ncbi:hypothetical protein PsorP6_010611 [Peronosclerospora sorghi]|uniref:Uncharacterized protein n=1 Tax=Peronosclerospora sorghi TaxID=230839 RepID=A0ACC0VXD0_9STRA|nr:hypothetical protein PsorP6_010611 [Peronosclerospora sorghi]
MLQWLRPSELTAFFSSRLKQVAPKREYVNVDFYCCDAVQNLPIRDGLTREQPKDSSEHDLTKHIAEYQRKLKATRASMVIVNMVNVVVKTLFRVFASTASVSVTLSMIPSVYRFYCTKDTGIASVLPLVCMFANAHVWMLNGIAEENWFPMFATFLSSDILSIGYVSVFCYYARDRKKALRRVIVAMIILSFITVYAILGYQGHTKQSRDGVSMTLGIFGVLAGLAVYSSPFERIMKVLHYKSAAFIPIPMVVAGIVNNVSWIVYCPMIGSWFLFGANAMCLLINLVSAVLYVIYNPKTHPLHLDKDDPEADYPRELASLSTLSPLPFKDDRGSMTKQNVASPVYTLMRSPGAADVGTRV